jgi:O-antigen ligase
MSSLNRLTTVRSYKDLEKMDLRFTMYRISFEVGLKSKSIFGSGTKTSGHEMFNYSKELASNFLPETHKIWADRYNSHNALLTIWIEMGWVGLIAVLIFLWLWFRPALRGPPLLMMPLLAVCVGQILDYFVWEIFFMAFQSFFFAHFTATITFQEMDQSSS